MAQTKAKPQQAADEAVEAVQDEVVDGEVVAEEIGEAEERVVGTALEDIEAGETGRVELGQIENAALAVREHVTVSPATMPTPNEWSAMRAMAETICTTDFVPRDFRNRPEAVLAAILSGRELGIGPMQSLKDISIIDGRPALAAHLVLALLRKGGVEILDSESTGQRAWIRARRRDTGEVAEVEWTMEEAGRAGLDSKTNFRKYPADMLWARAVGRLGRRIGSDLLAGMPYTAEEVRDFDDDLGSYDSTPIVRGPIETHKVDGPGQTPVPRTFPEIDERIKKVWGEEASFDFWFFARQLTAHLYEKESQKDLTTEERKVVGQKLASALLKLIEDVPRDVPIPEREEVQRAFASVLDGTMLPGPGWAMSAEEAKTMPSREAVEAAEAQPEPEPETKEESE